MNESGIHPAGHHILVKPNKSFESKEGIIAIPESAKERHSLAQVDGTLIAVGSLAWQHPDFGNGNLWAKPGDRVLFAKYGGTQMKGKDGQQYRILNDTDINAVLDSDIEVD